MAKKNGAKAADPLVDSRKWSCGLIMPISSLDGCSAEHWEEVRGIITEATETIESRTIGVKLVSEADDVGVIQKRIVQNIYNSDVVVCDVSGKNPNVMFELGMRLAFDKPTIIVKDDKTDFSFDTSIIEHLIYPRDLRFNKIVAFKERVAEKLNATLKLIETDSSQSTFLKNFGKFHVANLDEATIPADKLLVEMVSELQADVARLSRRTGKNENRTSDQRKTKGLDRIYRELTKWLNSTPGRALPDVSEDSLPSDFRREMERICDAPRYFSGPSEFEESLTRAVQNLKESTGA